MLSKGKKTGPLLCFITHFDIFPMLRPTQSSSWREKLIQPQQLRLGEEKGTKSLPYIGTGRCGWTIQDPSAFHSPWKAWLEWRQTSPQRKNGVHFYNQDNNKRSLQRSADVSFLPNEALDNHARIKRPLWTSRRRFLFMITSFLIRPPRQMHLQSAMATMKTDWKGNEKVQKRAGGKNFWQPSFAWEALTLSAVIKTIFWIWCLFLWTDVRKKPVSNLYKTRKHQYLIFNSHDTVFGLEQRFFSRCYRTLVAYQIYWYIHKYVVWYAPLWPFYRFLDCI